MPLSVDPLIQTTDDCPWPEQQSGTEAVVLPDEIELSSGAWEAFVLPLNYTRMSDILREFQQGMQIAKVPAGYVNGMNVFFEV